MKFQIAIGAELGMTALLPQEILEGDYQLREDALTSWKECLNNNDALQPTNLSV